MTMAPAGTMIEEEDKENARNANRDETRNASEVKGPHPHCAKDTGEGGGPPTAPTLAMETEKRSMSLDMTDLLMVSPPPPSSSLTPSAGADSATPPPPPGSETVVSAIRLVEGALDAEIRHVRILAGAGGDGSAAEWCASGGGRRADFTSPESDCDCSPSPPTFPPMGSVASAFRSPKRAAATTTTPMSYSSLGKNTTAAASPLPNKSLLPILTTLEEEQNHAYDSGHKSLDDGGVHSNGAEFGGKRMPKVLGKGKAEEGSPQRDGGEAESKRSKKSIGKAQVNATPPVEVDFCGDVYSSDDDDDKEEPNPRASDVVKGFLRLNLNDDDGSFSSKTKSSSGGSSLCRSKITEKDKEDDESASSWTSIVSRGGAGAACEPAANTGPVEAILDGGFSGLTIQDKEESSDAEGKADASSSPVSVNIFSDTSFDESYLEGKRGSSVSEDSDAGSLEKEDEESIECFDACGCWALDDEHKGDLYLSNNSDVKWPKIRLPLSLYNKLFRHQRIGVQWMASLHRNKIKGGILADDMGLGKTYQTLAYLGSLARAQTISNAIVVCPKSVVRSWEREANLVFKNICVPKASVYAVTSDMSKEKRKRVFTDAFTSSSRAPRLVVTTYGLVSNHITDLNAIAGTFPGCQWCYVVLDEGHIIKNRKTRISQDVRVLARSKKTRRLLLTGTPIQNNMKELHSLFDWATSSELLGSIQTFLNKYGVPIEEGRQRNASEWTIKKAAEMNVKLKKVLQPYFLQRLKNTEFEDKLPGKKELVVFTRLSKKQRKMYENFTASAFDGDMGSPLAAVSWLKMLCGHPSLVKQASGKYKDCDTDLLMKDSTKLQVLLALLNRLKLSGHRALVFSQSTKMLDIMEKVFGGSLSYLRIDGSTRNGDRQKNIDHFNLPNAGIDVMLLSTKAAGVGVTLTGADRAVIYDPSWNPAEDSQAVDRCYRIGQTKSVTVYRFIAAGTVEEKMYEKQVHKDGIKRVILSSDRSTARYFDRAELADLFKLSPEGECAMMQKFNEKMNNNAAGASGKPSFLTKHTSVIGVASHDVLYSNATMNLDESSPREDETPFSRSPFQKSTASKKHHMQPIEIEDPMPEAHDIEVKPLGGLNRTRQKRADAESKRCKERTSGSEGWVEEGLTRVDTFVAEQQLNKAMDMLLGLVDTDFDSIKREDKLSIHKRIAHVASLLGWL